MRVFRVALLYAVVLALIVLGLQREVHGQPPDHTNPEWGPWFQMLKQPDHPQIGCCSVADCRLTRYRIVAGQYEAEVTNSEFVTDSDGTSSMHDVKLWVKVQPEKILQHTDNPTGQAVVCWNGHDVLCFVRPPET